MTAIPVVMGGASSSRRVLPAGAIDAMFVLGLVTLGLIGFRPVYGGEAYLVVGILGALLGVAITEVARKLRQPVLAEAVVTVLAFVIFGGATTTGHGFPTGLLPTGSSISALGHVGVFGWKDLLTTAPPVGNSSNLLAIPYIVGLIGGVAGQSLARRTSSSFLPLLGPILVLSLGILFGARYPTSLLLQGSLFGFLALTWIVLRYQRTVTVTAAPGFGRNRLLLSAGVLAVVGLGAGVVGPNLPGARGGHRVVLSQYVVPPFEAAIQPSPLAGFRQYVPQGALHSKVLFTVNGLSPGSEIRVATMDEYDGVVWGFGAGGSDASTPSSDVFRRYGSTIQPGGIGQNEDINVTVGQLDGIWLPEVGEVTGISFPSPDPATMTTSFAYDTDTETAAAPSGLQPGETYSMKTDVVPAVSNTELLDRLGAGDAPVSVSGVPSVLQADASNWSSNASSPYAKVMAIAHHLESTGYFSDGLEDPPLSLPGHSTGRLISFLNGGPLVGNQIVGDGEQYAAAFALMANSIGVPARVVLGAKVGSGGVVTGASVEPWVEVDLAGVGWQPIYSDAFMNPNHKAHQTPPIIRPNNSTAPPVEPPVVSAIHTPLDDQLPGSQSSSLSHASSNPFQFPGWVTTLAEWVIPVIALLTGITVLIGSLKRQRRKRRQSGTPASQIAGAWRELVDLSRDLGVAVPAHRTRREQAVFLTPAEALALAAEGDAAVFGPGQPTEEIVRNYWRSVENLGAQMRTGLGWFGRWRALVSLRSLVLNTAAQRVR